MDVLDETVWNTSRIRHQQELHLPNGVPSHLCLFIYIYEFREQYSFKLNCEAMFKRGRLSLLEVSQKRTDDKD